MTTTKTEAAVASSAPAATLWRCGGRQCPPGECDHEERELHRHAAGGGPRFAPPFVHDVLRSSGRPLPTLDRTEMESRLRHSFADVRIHTGDQAARAADSVRATAFTVGKHIVMGARAPDSASAEGRQVLAHELAHVLHSNGDAPPAARLRVSRPDDPQELAAEGVARGIVGSAPIPAPRAVQPPQLYRLGANPGCTPAEADDIHQAIFDARGWLAKAIRLMGESPLGDRARRSLRRNFGPTYGVEANRELIRNRLVTARSVLSTMPISCMGAEDATCATNPCGWAVAGSRAATICRNVTFTAGASEVFQAGCVLHESFHATFARFDVDSYSGWHGHSGSTAGYPGAGVDPLLNADSYTTLVMDLS